jgi:thiamine biosynthesis lipoprotein
VGAISKGYGIEQVQYILEKYNVSNYLLNVGGDMAYGGTNPKGKPWSIGIQNPRPSENNKNVLLGVVTAPPLPFKGIATSGDYQKARVEKGKRKHHIINGLTGEPISNKQSLTVLSNSPLKADLMATFLFTLPIPEILKLSETDSTLEVMIVDSLGHIHSSSKMKSMFKAL